ncbi:unnamed protein product [Calypogeia fissa]
MAIAGLYRRALPSPPATDFGSAEGKMIFREALQDGTMEGFFPLIAHFQTQAEPAFCGLASLSVVLNALAIDPRRTWKGPWRWIDETMLECCESLEKVKAEGMTFAKVACAGACAGASVRAIRSNKSSLDEFRQYLLESCLSEDKHMIVSYDRKIFKQTGRGHFSPIGGYHREKDLALILDVARFKYPPHWVPLGLLWEAINTMDPTTSNWRGFMLATKPKRNPSVLFTLSCKDELWRPISKYLYEEVPKLLSNAAIASPQEAVSTILGLLPGNVAVFVKWIAEVQRADMTSTNSPSESDLTLSAKVKILEDLRRTELYYIVSNWVEGACIGCQLPALCKGVSESLKSACCHGAAALSGMLNSSSLRCTKTCASKNLNSGTETTMVVKDTLSGNGVHKNVNILVPTSIVCDGEKNCTSLPPGSADMLTMLLFALPPNCWSSVRNKEVESALSDAASSVDLPISFQVEVENLREQLNWLYRWCNGNIEEDFE